MSRSVRTRLAVSLTGLAVLTAGALVTWPTAEAEVREPRATAASAELGTTDFAHSGAERAVDVLITVPDDAPGPAAAALPALPAASPPPPPPLPPPVVVQPVAQRGGGQASRSRTRSAPAAAPAAGAPAAAAPAPVTSSPSYAGSLASGVNAQRAAAGLPGLASSGCAQQYAQAWAEHLASTGAFEHQSLGSVLSGCGARGAGENIARTGGSASSMVGMWMDSPGHRANILDPGFTHSGVAAVQNAAGEWIGVQVFLTL